MDLSRHVHNAQLARLACQPQGFTPDRAGVAEWRRIGFGQSIHVSRS
jgi:hypothetical protein